MGDDRMDRHAPVLMTLKSRLSLAMLFVSLAWQASPGLADSYQTASFSGGQLRELELVLSQGEVEIAGRSGTALLMNDQTPGPTLRWVEGDRVRIRVRNTMSVASSVHWHGLLLPNSQDGVPGLTNLPIEPGSSHTFEFPLRQAGTYWYHAHTGLQEQRGLYGAIVIEDPEENRNYDREHVVVLSDWTFESPEEILRLLKRGSQTFALKKGSVQSLWGAFRAGALKEFLQREWGRMPSMDLSDVAYDAFLTNGKPEKILVAEGGQRIRLRIINAAASSYFYLDWAGAPLGVIAADGQDVQTVDIPRILIGVAETYDVIVTAPEHGAREFRATAQDGSGKTSLWIGSRHASMGHDSHRMSAADVPPPDLYGGSHDQPKGPEASVNLDEQHGGHGGHHAPGISRPPVPYSSLRSRVDTSPPAEAPVRDITLNLTGDMERYVWSFDNRTLSEADVIPVARGEVLRLTLKNETMMHHPLHLHGHFFRVLNGQGSHAPLKHTVDVPPMGEISIEFLADESGDWFFHCHILYHMKAGMARIFHYEDWVPDPDLKISRSELLAEHWYTSADMNFLSNFTSGELSASTTRSQLGVEWKSGWKTFGGNTERTRRMRTSRHAGTHPGPTPVRNIHYEVFLSYRYHFNRFYRLYTAQSLNDEENFFLFGVEALLPLSIDSKIWMDSRGEGRVSLSKEWQLTSLLHSEAEVEYDTREGWEGGVLLEYSLNRYLAVSAGWHSDYGAGGGLSIHY